MYFKSIEPALVACHAARAARLHPNQDEDLGAFFDSYRGRLAPIVVVLLLPVCDVLASVWSACLELDVAASSSLAAALVPRFTTGPAEPEGPGAGCRMARSEGLR